MRHLIYTIVGVLFVYSFTSGSAKGDSTSKEVRKPMHAVFENSVRYTWSQKKVLASRSLVDMKDPSTWPEGIEIGTKHYKSGSKSFRLRSPGGFSLKFDKEDWTDYNRISFWVYPEQTTEQGILHAQISMRVADYPKPPLERWYIDNHRQHLRPNVWNHVIWEIPHLKERNKVTLFNIRFQNRQSWPAEEMDVTVYMDEIKLEKVEADHYEGWNVAPGKIAFSHIGYKPSLSKTAISSNIASPEFEVIDAASGKTVLKKPLQQRSTRLGNFQVFDFSEVCRPGTYILKAGGVQSRSFSIKEDIWRGTIFKILNFFYTQRDACYIPDIQPAFRHQDSQGYRPDQPHIRRLITGGWHDAGDLANHLACTSNITYNMFNFADMLAKRGDDNELYERILEEAKVGLTYLLKTNFGDGYRIILRYHSSRKGEFGWTDGIPNTTDDTVTEAQISPPQMFICAAAEALAYQVLKDKEPDLAQRSLALAEEDWRQAVKREYEWSNEIGGLFNYEKNVTYSEKGSSAKMKGPFYTASWGVISSIELFKATGMRHYAMQAVKYGKIILDCQENHFLLDLPITGYFYTNREKVKLVHNFIHGREYAPILALSLLCEYYPDYEDWIKWYAGIVMHSEYFLEMAKYSDPYFMLPSGVYREDDYLLFRDEVQEQRRKHVREGMKVGKNHYFRFLPAWVGNCNGSNDVVLGASLALCAAGHTRGNFASEELAQKQLQWIIGRNPFCKSTVWGEGYNYHDLLSFSKGAVVGAIPVGIDCYRNDEPFWSGSSYFVASEPWGEPSARFMWNAAYLSPSPIVTGEINSPNIKNITFLNIKSGERTKVKIDEYGKFRRELAPGDYSIKFGDVEKSLTLLSGKKYDLKLDHVNAVDFKVSTATNKDLTTIKIVAEGRGKHKFKLRAFNLKLSETEKEIDLRLGKSEIVIWQGKVIDANMPWIAVVIPDGENVWQKEVFGQVRFKKE